MRLHANTITKMVLVSLLRDLTEVQITLLTCAFLVVQAYSTLLCYSCSTYMKEESTERPRRIAKRHSQCIKSSNLYHRLCQTRALLYCISCLTNRWVLILPMRYHLVELLTRAHVSQPTTFLQEITAAFNVESIFERLVQPGDVL